MAHLRPGGSSSAPAVVAASSATLAIRQKAYAELLQAMVVRSFAACSRPAVAAAQTHFPLNQADCGAARERTNALARAMLHPHSAQAKGIPEPASQCRDRVADADGRSRAGDD
jgi:hypothetical protein